MATTVAYRSQLSPGGSLGGGLHSGEHFPDPFLDMASLAMPSSVKSMLQWCEYIYMSQGTYRTAMERILSYFLTDIEIREANDDEREKWMDFLREVFNVIPSTQSLLRDRMCYGNGFASILVPFRRLLSCPKCGVVFPLKVVHENSEFNFSNAELDFSATCPKCKTGSGYKGPWKVIDEPDNLEKNLKIKRWSPHEIEMVHCPYTDDASYYWRIPEDYKRRIRQGHLYHLERANLDVIKAIKHNQVYRFNEDVLFHMKEPTLAGLRNRGWGLPRTLINFRQIWYVQVLQRYNESIALDYVIPFRVITPVARSGSSNAGGGTVTDPLLNISMGDFMSSVRSMIRKRRRDPAAWQTLPFPIQYQALGGDASQLAPVDLLNQGVERLLNDAGTPVELYKGTLQLQAAPVSLRLFESQWHHLVHDANMFLQWAVRQVAQILSWEDVEARLQRVTHADDMNKQMAILQLMMSQQVSGKTGLGMMGLDWGDEQQQLGEEARKQQEIQARIQEEMEQAGFAQQIAAGGMTGPMAPAQAAAGGGGGAAPGGAPPAGGDPAAAGGDPAMAGAGPVTGYLQSMGSNASVTPQDMMAEADSLAQQLLGMPEGVKDSELRRLKQANPFLHSLVKQRMDEIRRDARMQGGAAVMQQQFGGG